jgi:hypothetical protein
MTRYVWGAADVALHFAGGKVSVGAVEREVA